MVSRNRVSELRWRHGIGAGAVLIGALLNLLVSLDVWPVGWATIIGWALFVTGWVWMVESMRDAAFEMLRWTIHYRHPNAEDYEWITEQMAARAQQRGTK